MPIMKQKPPICYRLHEEAAVQCRSWSKNLQYVNGSNYLAGAIVDGLNIQWWIRLIFTLNLFFSLCLNFSDHGPIRQQTIRASDQ
ncbi:hypothetical protein LguiA_005124 [Lonicera macranthoides]